MTAPDHHPTPRPAPGALPDLVSELWEMITAYVRQETVEPIKGVGRFVAFGTLGALLIGTGVVLLAVGGLRALQGETDGTFDGNLTWLPYVIVFVALVIGGVASLAAVGGRGRGERQ